MFGADFLTSPLIRCSQFRWGNSSFHIQVIFTEITSAAELPANYNQGLHTCQFCSAFSVRACIVFWFVEHNFMGPELSSVCSGPLLTSVGCDPKTSWDSTCFLALLPIFWCWQGPCCPSTCDVGHSLNKNKQTKKADVHLNYLHMYDEHVWSVKSHDTKLDLVLYFLVIRPASLSARATVQR